MTGPIQLGGCEICGSPKHKTKNCTQSKQQREERKEQTKSFHAAKKKTLASMKSSERAASGAFKAKHVASKGKSLAKSSAQVAKERTWGGGSSSGRSTVATMSEEDLAKERRFQIEGLKMSESTVADEGISAQFGVNKATRHAYPTKSSTVQSDRQGKRTIREEKETLAKPVLGLRVTEIHHLHVVEEKDSDK